MITSEEFLKLGIKTKKRDFVPYFKYLMELLMNEKYEEYYYLLDNIDLKETNIVVMISILRLSAYKVNIGVMDCKSWNNFLNRATKELINRNYKEEDIFYGLNKI
jgi:hypothetical protein